MIDHDRNEPGLRLLDAIHDHVALLQGAVWRIESIINNLASVGLDKPAEQLDAAIDGLIESAQNISGAHSQKLNADIRHSEDMIGGMLTLAINGCLQSPKKRKERAS